MTNKTTSGYTKSKIDLMDVMKKSKEQNERSRLEWDKKLAMIGADGAFSEDVFKSPNETFEEWFDRKTNETFKYKAAGMDESVMPKGE